MTLGNDTPVARALEGAARVREKFGVPVFEGEDEVREDGARDEDVVWCNTDLACIVDFAPEDAFGSDGQWRILARGRRGQRGAENHWRFPAQFEG
jgi:hypothetical protein